MLMNVVMVLIGAITMQLVITVQEITSALATLGIQAMVSYAPVSLSIFQSHEM